MTSSTPKHSIFNFFDDFQFIDVEKYKKKGYGKYFGFFLIILHFTLLPKILQLFLSILSIYLPNQIIPGVGIVMINIFIQVVYNLNMYFIYTGKYEFFEQYRISNSKWPWEQNYQEWIQLLKRTLKSLLFNTFIIGCPLILFNSLTTNYNTSLHQLPTPTTTIPHIIYFIIIQDFLYYLFHMLLHHPSFYNFHKRHHQYNITVSISAQYCHPIQTIFGNSLPIAIAFKSLNIMTNNVHCITIWIFMVFRVVESIHGHTGYEWSWRMSELFPLSAGSRQHNFHHSHNVGNYGSYFKVWDTLFGTNIDYKRYEKERMKKVIMKGGGQGLRLDKSYKQQ